MNPILHINRSSAFGGLELYTVRLLKALHQAGTPVIAYCLKDSRIYHELKQGGIEVIAACGQQQRSIQEIVRAHSIIRKRTIQLVHSHSRLDVWLGSLATIATRCRHLTSVYMGIVKKRDPFHAFIYGRLTALFSTSHIQNQTIARFYPIHPEKIHLLRYGCDLAHYHTDSVKRTQIRKRHHCTDRETVVGILSRLDPQKGLKTLAESFLHLPGSTQKHIRFWIVGEPSLSHIDQNGRPVYESESLALRSWLINFIRSNKLSANIHLIPFQKDYIAYLSAMDIYVLSSHSEMYSLGLIEAMLMSKAIIATNSGGTPEQIKHNERGLLVTPGDAPDFAKAIERYAGDNQLRLTMGTNARLWAEEEHAMANTLKRLQEMYAACSQREPAMTLQSLRIEPTQI